MSQVNPEHQIYKNLVAGPTGRSVEKEGLTTAHLEYVGQHVKHAALNAIAPSVTKHIGPGVDRAYRLGKSVYNLGHVIHGLASQK
jgi:hypothetical protein